MADKKDSHNTSAGSPLPYYAPAYTEQSQPLLVNQPDPNNTTVITMAPRQSASQKEAPAYDNCHLVWAIISLFCCQVFGVIAAVMAILGYTDHRTGNYVNYRRKRRCAIGFLVVAILVGILVIGGYIVCVYFHGEEGGVNQVKTWMYSWSSANRDTGAHIDIDNSGFDADIHRDTGYYDYND